MKKEHNTSELENEKRLFIRHPSDIPIEIQMENVVSHRTEYLNNISFGGLSFKSKIYLEKGTIIKIKIPLVRPVFEAKGEVVWCEKKGDYYNVGVEFLDVDSAFKARMIEQICHIEHYKKEVYEKEGRNLTGEEAALEWIQKYAEKFPFDINET